jgi:DNA-binding transcriptional ArsR family regulator
MSGYRGAQLAELRGLESEVGLEDWLLAVWRFRDLRNQLFGRELFADPAWDILLFLADGTGRSQGDIDCIAQATNLSRNLVTRWLYILEERGLVRSLNNFEFCLTPDAIKKLRLAFSV